MGTTTSSLAGALVTSDLSPVFVDSFVSLVDTPDTHRKLVSVKSPLDLVDMFGRRYPRRVALWVHHFDDYGVLVEGTYCIVLARRALKKAGYDLGASALWGYRPIAVGAEQVSWPRGVQVGGRSGVAFYFDVKESML